MSGEISHKISNRTTNRNLKVLASSRKIYHIVSQVVSLRCGTVSSTQECLLEAIARISSVAAFPT